MTIHGELVSQLESLGYSYTLIDGAVTVTHEGDVEMTEVEVIGPGVTFANKGYIEMPNVAEIGGNVSFKNEGDINLHRVTKIGTNVSFDNDGCGWLDWLVTLSDLTFNNKGFVNLPSVTKIGKKVKFYNKGSVYLPKVAGRHMYRGVEWEFRTIDGTTMIIGGSHRNRAYTVHSARYFGGGDIERLHRCYIAEADGIYARGRTVKSAIEDLKFKMANSVGV
jgi:hypothetical protein